MRTLPRRPAGNYAVARHDRLQSPPPGGWRRQKVRARPGRPWHCIPSRRRPRTFPGRRSRLASRGKRSPKAPVPHVCHCARRCCSVTLLRRSGVWR